VKQDDGCNPAQGRGPEARTHQILDHLFDQWLILGDVFKTVDPAVAISTPEELDTHLDEFIAEIDPSGLDHAWYEVGRRTIRDELLRRMNTSVSDHVRRSG
jgi:hypothetical protein